MPEARSYDVGVCCRDLVGDTRRLLSILRTGARPRLEALREWVAHFGPRTRWYGWTDDDPLPALMGFLVRPLKALGILRRVPEPVGSKDPVTGVPVMGRSHAGA